MIQALSHYRILDYKAANDPRGVVRAAAASSTETKPSSFKEILAKKEDMSRSELLNSVRERLKKGFYNSDAVIEDLSTSFASVFNQKQ